MDENTSSLTADKADFIDLTADIVAAYVANNSVPVAELPTLLAGIHAALVGLGFPSASAEPAAEKPTPAQIRKSVTPDALISFIDGKPYKTLKRHLTGNGLTFEEYRQRFGLSRDYPSTAANYSAMRAEFARSNGLGQQRRKAAAKSTAVDATITETPKTRSQKQAAEPVVAIAEKPARARKPKKAAAAK